MGRAWVVVIVLLSGCSMAFMETVPPRWTPRDEPRCTASGGWAGWDLLLAMGNGGAAVAYGVTANKVDQESGLSREERKSAKVTVGAFAVVALAYVASSAYGVHQQQRCKRARAAHDRMRIQAKP